MDYSSTFHALPLGAVYRQGGSIWRKRSARTCQLLSYGQGPVRADAWFYARLAEHCVALLPYTK